MKTGEFGLMCSLITLSASRQVSAGVFDDVKVWWHLGYDASSITTPDGIELTKSVPITSGGPPYGNMAIVMVPATRTTTRHHDRCQVT